jgi:hypothetical protein
MGMRRGREGDMVNEMGGRQRREMGTERASVRKGEGGSELIKTGGMKREGTRKVRRGSRDMRGWVMDLR